MGGGGGRDESEELAPVARVRRICSMCGADPCESPGWCRAQARAENEERDDEPGSYEDD